MLHSELCLKSKDALTQIVSWWRYSYNHAFLETGKRLAILVLVDDFQTPTYILLISLRFAHASNTMNDSSQGLGWDLMNHIQLPIPSQCSHDSDVVIISQPPTHPTGFFQWEWREGKMMGDSPNGP